MSKSSKIGKKLKKFKKNMNANDASAVGKFVVSGAFGRKEALSIIFAMRTLKDKPDGYIKLAFNSMKKAGFSEDQAITFVDDADSFIQDLRR